MQKWKLEFTVNGVRSEAIIAAYSSMDAKRLLEWQYYGQRVLVINYTRL